MDNDLNRTSDLNQDREQSLELFESMTRRDFDLELLADKIEAHYLLPAPKDLMASVLREASRPEVQLEIQARRLSKRAQLLLYSFKVGTAVVGALLLLSLGSGFRGGGRPLRMGLLSRPPEAGVIQEQNRQFSDYFDQISDKLFQDGGILK